MNATKYAIEKIVMSCMSNNCLPSGFFLHFGPFFKLILQIYLKKTYSAFGGTNVIGTMVQHDGADAP